MPEFTKRYYKNVVYSKFCLFVKTENAYTYWLLFFVLEDNK
jgi:hypothetical protein